MKPESKKTIYIKKEELKTLISVAGVPMKKVAAICGCDRQSLYYFLSVEKMKKIYLLRLGRVVARKLDGTKLTPQQTKAKTILESKLELSLPEIAKKRIRAREEFELCYLRHQYIRRSKYNATAEEMKPFMKIVEHLSRKTFFTYKNLFLLVGLDLEDVINIATVHLNSFLGLFSLEKMPGKYKDFIQAFKNSQDVTPEAEDFLDKNKANFTMFLKQRMEDVVRVCRQKARNIKGIPVEEYFYYCGTNKPPRILRELVKNYEKLGFKKLESAVYKTIRKRAGKTNETSFFFNKKYYVAVPVEKRSLTVDDLNGADVSPYDNLHNMSPEDVLFNLEESKILEDKFRAFRKSSRLSKVSLIEDFIQKNKSNPFYEEEVGIARKMLRDLT